MLVRAKGGVVARLARREGGPVVLLARVEGGAVVRKMDPWPIYFGFWCLMTNTTKLD